MDRLKIEHLLQYQNSKDETALHVTCVHDKPEFIRALINLGKIFNLVSFTFATFNVPLSLYLSATEYVSADLSDQDMKSLWEAQDPLL